MKEQCTMSFKMAEYDFNYAQLNRLVQQYYKIGTEGEKREKNQAVLLATLVGEYTPQDINSAKKFADFQTFWEEQIGRENKATFDLGGLGKYYAPVSGMILNLLVNAAPLIDAAIEYYFTRTFEPSFSLLCPGIMFAQWLSSVKKLKSEEYCLFLQTASLFSKEKDYFSFEELECIFPEGDARYCIAPRIEDCEKQRWIDKNLYCDMRYLFKTANKSYVQSKSNLESLLKQLEDKGLIYKESGGYKFFK